MLLDLCVSECNWTYHATKNPPTALALHHHGRWYRLKTYLYQRVFFVVIAVCWSPLIRERLPLNISRKGENLSHFAVKKWTSSKSYLDLMVCRRVPQCGRRWLQIFIICAGSDNAVFQNSRIMEKLRPMNKFLRPHSEFWDPRVTWNGEKIIAILPSELYDPTANKSYRSLASE